MAQEIDENDEAKRIHDRLDETRNALSEKLEALQDRMKDTVDTTRETVEETMRTVKQSVQDTLQSIKSTFDIKLQTQKHPLCMLSSSVFLGVFLSHLSDRRPAAGHDRSTRKASGAAKTDPVASTMADSAQPAGGPSLKQRLASQFHEELTKVQGLAIGVGAGIFRDWVKKAMPSIAAKLEEVIDSATSKMGGEPVEGPVLRKSHNGHGE